jgi:acetolactate synthase I/II/III large subunit
MYGMSASIPALMSLRRGLPISAIASLTGCQLPLRTASTTSRIEHELGLLLVYLVAAVRVGDVLCVRHELGELLLGFCGTMAPLTKLAHQIVRPATIPSIVREAPRLAQQERPGPVHLELPEDIAHEETADIPLMQRHPIDIPVAHPTALDRAADLILRAERPLVMLGAAASRPRLADALSDFVHRMGIPFFNTQMGKGAVHGGSSLYMGTAALSEGDVHQAIDRADLIISIGHDTVEKPPFIMGSKGPTVLHVGYLPATIEEVYFPHAEVVGDSARASRCWPTVLRAS